MRSLLIPRTVRARLTLWNMLILALVFLALGVILRAGVARNLLASVDADLALRSDRHVHFWATVPNASHEPPHRPARPGGRPDAGPPPEVVRPASRWRTPVAEGVFDLNGVQSWPPSERKVPWDAVAFARAVQGRSNFSYARDGDIQLRVYTVPLRRKSGQIAGVAQLAASLTGLERALGDLDRALLALAPIGLAITWAGGMFLTGRMLRPVREVTRAAGRIGAEDLSERLPVTGHDEFSELAATFNGMLTRLEVAFRQQRRFTADASHELRTPLTVVKSVTSRLLAGNDVPEGCRKGMERIDRAAGVMGSVVQDLLLLARSDAGQLDLQLHPVRLSEVLEDALAGTTVEKGPQIRDLTAASPLLVFGDVGHLTRLFSNLIDNAVRHTAREGCITLSAHSDGAHVIVTVADTGCGIALEHLPHVTERFYRVDAARTRAHGGTGLGLAICQSIAEAHSGDLQLVSEVGVGTVVFVTLPAAGASAVN